MPSSVNVPSSISSASRSRAVSLSCSCWRRDLLLAAAELRLLAPLVQLLHERAQRRARHERVRGRAIGHGCGPEVVEERLEHVHRRLRRGDPLLLVLGRLERRDLEPDQLAVLEHRVEQVVELVRMRGRRARAPRRGSAPGPARRGRGARRRARRRARSSPPRASRSCSPRSRWRGSARAAPARPRRGRACRRAPRARPAPPRRGRRPTRRVAPPGTCRRGSRCLRCPACCSRRARRATGCAPRAGCGSRPGSVVTDTEQSAASSTGVSPAASASSIWPPASSRQPRDSRRSSS